MELALQFSASSFFGFDPSPASQIVAQKSLGLGLKNITMLRDDEEIRRGSSYDLIITSHVVEHLIDFRPLAQLNSLLTEQGLFYLEVPDSLEYENQPRREFLYYFDRLHVNHFTPQSLSQLGSLYGFSHYSHFKYTFPYRDGGQYPALGMLFQKGERQRDIASPSILGSAQRYIKGEQERANKTASQFESHENLLVWGAGDNFFRSSSNGGPLSKIGNLVILDRRKQELELGGKRFTAMDPVEGITTYDWPIVIAISEGRQSLIESVLQVDPKRQIYCI